MPLLHSLLVAAFIHGALTSHHPSHTSNFMTAEYNAHATERITSNVHSYTFKSVVAPILRIDLDIHEIVHLMSTAGFSATQWRINLNQAKLIFSVGGHSSSHADLTVPPLSRSVAVGEFVSQSTRWNGNLGGRVTKSASQGSSDLQVAYTSIWRPCFGGGAVDFMTAGAYGSTQNASLNCFSTQYHLKIIASKGYSSVDIGNPLKVHTSFQSLASPTEDVRGEKYSEIFTKYFGSGSYAKTIVHLALDGQGPFANLAHTQFRTAAVKTSIAALAVWMKVVDKMSSAIVACSLEEWDIAVALFAGSQWNSLRGGYMLFGLSLGMCSEFATCDQDGMSITNNKILDLFQNGQAMLEKSECAGTELDEIKQNIVELMTVPLVQGLLRSAYQIEADKSLGSQGTAQGRDRILGHVFAMAVLPLLSNCDDQSQGVANIVDGMMRIDSSNPQSLSQGILKDRVQSLYSCLGITCKDVGGLVDFSKGGVGYLKGAEPCDHLVKSAPEPEKEKLGTGLIVLITLGSVAVLLVASGFTYKFLCKVKRQKDQLANSQNVMDALENIPDVEVVVGNPVVPNAIGSSANASAGVPMQSDQKGEGKEIGVQAGNPASIAEFSNAAVCVATPAQDSSAK